MLRKIKPINEWFKELEDYIWPLGTSPLTPEEQNQVIALFRDIRHEPLKELKSLIVFERNDKDEGGYSLHSGDTKWAFDLVTEMIDESLKEN